MATTAGARAGGVAEVSVIDDDLAQEFLAIYRAAFAPLETRAPARQTLTDEEFLAQMTDPSVVKFVVSDGAGEACGLAFMTADLGRVPWISPAYFHARFPEHRARDALYYVGAFLVRPERQGGPWALRLMEQMIRRLARERAVAAFDCCEYTVSVVRLPELIARVGDRMSVLEPVELEPQRYFSYVWDGLR